VIAFARRAGRDRVIIAAGRFFTKLERTAADSFPTGAAWSDTRVILPPDFAPRRYVDLFTGCEIEARAQEGTAQLSQLSMDEVFARMPISMLVRSD
jgi:maltooligosyltrehalose synthase